MRYTPVFLSFIVLVIGISANDLQRLEQLSTAVALPAPQTKVLTALARSTPSASTSTFSMDAQARDWPLYRAYPALLKTLPRVVLCNVPTPVHRMSAFSQYLNQQGSVGIECYVKRDDKTGFCQPDQHYFGGNKPRKGELLFAHALSQAVHKRADQRDTIMTFGCVGSNHTVAMAACAKKVGMNCIVALKPQPPSPVVCRNLLLLRYYGAQLHYYPTLAARNQGALQVCLAHKQEKGFFPYVIPTGGSNQWGTIGYVNAAFELKEQIQQGLVPEPDVIYVAAGTKGTFVGLVLGLKVAGLKTKVVGVCTEPWQPQVFLESVQKLLKQTNSLLCQLDPSFPMVSISPEEFELVHDCVGKGYGVYSAEGKEAMESMRTTQGIILDGTYTAKACVALIRDARAGKLSGKKVMFWNTFCSDDFKNELYDQDYHALPSALHVYFE